MSTGRFLYEDIPKKRFEKSLRKMMKMKGYLAKVCGKRNSIQVISMFFFNNYQDIRTRACPWKIRGRNIAGEFTNVQ